ncbi:MAG: excinuclease ABC subunit UvrC [Planctomycetota bacterium]|jgi:excinuclease ABC subunit C
MSELRGKIDTLPRGPGVYLFKDEGGKVIYVGKAADLRARVRSYLGTTGDGRLATPHLARRIADVDFILTGNEKEALLLENTLIKRHRPRYNVRLRDDKAYLCIRVDTRHAWPRIHVVRRFRKDGALYFGPYSSAKAVRRTIRTLGAIYPLRLCTDRTLETRDRPCLYHQLKRCCAPCVDLVTPGEYRPMVDGMLQLLRGRTQGLVQRLKREMDEAAGRMEYERAASLRDQIEALERTTQAQRVATPDLEDRDVIGLARRGEVATAAVLHVREGRLLSKRDVSFKTILPDGAVLHRVIAAVYRPGRLVPPEIVLPALPEEAERLAAELGRRRGGVLRFKVPQRGKGRALLDLAARNAAEAVREAEGDESQRAGLLEALQRRLELGKVPARIECYDISTIQGAQTVGSRVVFQDALPDKDGYRRFKIRTVAGQDDFASLREVLKRRLARDDLRPDLIVIDGGAGQLGEVRRVLPAGIAAVGLAKARTLRGGGRKLERVYLPGRRTPVPLPPDAPESYLLARIRDEAHRFAIEYHRRLRRRRTVRSELDGIRGLGPKRRTALLRTFGSATGVREAGLEELRAAGMPEAVARAILAWAEQGDA